MSKKPRIEKTHLDEIKLPDITTITNILDWLALKQKDDKNTSKFCQSEEGKANSLAYQTSSIELRNQSCETTPIKLKDQSCQTASIKLRVQSCQANLEKHAEATCKTNHGLMTSRSQYESKSVQCNLRSAKIDPLSVKNKLNIDKGCQTDKVTRKRASNKTRCDLRKSGKGTCNKYSYGLSPKAECLKNQKLEIEPWNDKRLSGKAVCDEDSYVLSPKAECLENQKLEADPCNDKKQSSVNSIHSVSKAKIRASISPTTSGLLQVKSEKSVEVTICQICDQSLYSRKEVYKHKQTHMWCRICNKKFKTMARAQAHIYSPRIRQHQLTEKLKQPNWAVYVDLLKVDSCPTFKTEYPLAYKSLKNS